MRRTPSTEALRARLDHPVIDSDGHCIEYLPAVRDLVGELAGAEVESRFVAFNERLELWTRLSHEQRRSAGFLRPPWWGLPTRNTLDRATAMLPRLLYERLDELGIDFAVLYPTYGLLAQGIDDEEMRRAVTRAFNRYLAESYAEFSDRLAPVAIVQMHTPEEAIEELEYARGTLGLKAAMLASFVQRPLEASGGARPATWLDTFGFDSPYDYDPVWAKCEALGVAPTFHSSGMGWGSRASISSYVYNHLGNFAAAGDAICRSLLLDGVPRRFPRLRFAFLEGGVGWGATLYGDLIGHFEKRNRVHVRHYDPAALDRPLLAKLLAEYGSPAIAERSGELDGALRLLSNPDEPADALDEFARSGIEQAEDIRDVFERSFFFGCEADDPSNAAAFETRRNPFGSRLRAIFSSDIGHWDVPDMRDVLHEAWELVEKGLLSEGDFRDFVYGNPLALWTGAAPDFFRGTRLEAEAATSGPGGTAAG